MSFVVKPPLERIALAKVAAILWNQPDIRVLVENFLNSKVSAEYDIGLSIPPDDDDVENNEEEEEKVVELSRREQWEVIENRVIEKGRELIIPMSLKSKLLTYIQPVGIQIMKWIVYHHKYCCFDSGLPSEFCWTPQGTIDKKNTAKMLIKDENIDISTRYKLACTYCFKDDVIKLWKELPVNEKRFDYQDDDSNILKYTFLSHWEYYLTGDPRNTLHFFEYLLHAAESGNKTAVEYFLSHIACGRERILVKAALVVAKDHCDSMCPKIYYNEVLCFLFAKMTHAQLVKVIEKHPLNILRHILDWPFQSLFIKMATFLWRFLPKAAYNSVLIMIIQKVRMGYRDYNYQELFQDLWHQIPRALKKTIRITASVSELLKVLLLTGDKQNLKLIFQDANPMERFELIFRQEHKKILLKMINLDELDLLVYYLQLSISSREDVAKFKAEYGDVNEFAVIDDVLQLCKKLIATIKKAIDTTLSKHNKKRTMDGGDNSSTKKSCCNIEDRV